MSQGFSIESDMSGWAERMKQRMEVMRTSPPIVLREQAGLFCRTMIAQTPPSTRAKTAKKIDQNADSKFAAISYSGDSEKSGGGDVRWLWANPRALYGVDRSHDDRAASESELLSFWFSTDKHGVKTIGKRGQQDVRVFMKYVVSPDALKRLIAHIKSHIGRLKGAWVPGWKHCGSPPGDFGPVPAWVERHGESAKAGRFGYVVDDLQNPSHPSITIVNRAKGVQEIVKAGIVEKALRIRLRAMVNDTKLYIAGIKKVK